MAVPVWLVVVLGLGTGLAALLAVLLWSTRTQRYTRVRTGGLDPLPELLPAIQGLTEGWIVEGNAITLLENGDGFYGALLRDIRSATANIHLETYAWSRGDICHDIADALCQRAREGIAVRLIVDALGSVRMEGEIVDRLLAAGCQLARYNDFRLRTVGRLNKRDHRKLAVFDGCRAYVFGHGVGSEWEGSGDRPESWRDLAARVEGPVVGRLQAVFAQNWMEETAELLADHKCFPRLEPAGDVPMHVISSSPRGGVSASSVLYRLMVACCREHLVIQNPYFAPSVEMVDLLAEAVSRGVCVQILLPGPVTDSRLVQYAGQYFFPRLLAAGVQIYQFQPTLNHQKVMVVDGQWAYLGSANFDERSFDINAEVGLGILHRGLCRQLCDLFEGDLRLAKPVDVDSWKRRSVATRLLEKAAYLLHEQL